MRTPGCVTACCITMTFLAQGIGANESVRVSDEGDLRPASQAISDVAGFDWIAVPARDRPQWCFVRMVPGEDSGRLTVFETDPKGSGKMFPLLLIYGTWKRNGSWNPDRPCLPEAGEFRWTEVEAGFTRLEKPEPLFLPTQADVSTLCLVHCPVEPIRVRTQPADLREVRPWDRVVMIPDGWDGEFSQAWKRYREIAPVLDAAKPDPAALRKLACDPNGPIAIAAIRRLCKHDLMDATAVRAALEQAKGIQRGVVAYSIVHGLDGMSLSALTPIFTDSALKAASIDDCKGWAAAGLAFENFAWSNRGRNKLGTALLEAARKRGRELGLSPEKEPSFFKHVPTFEGGVDDSDDPDAIKRLFHD